MKEVELKVHDMSTSIYPADAYALVLEEVGGERKLAVIIGQLEAQAIKVVLNKYKPPRPMTHDLFVEVGRCMDLFLQKVVIYDVKDGVYYANLYIDLSGEDIVIDSRTSDAVALALRYNAPIYTTEEILEQEHIQEIDDGSFTMSVNMISMPMLKEALRQAIEDEKYEQASRLRDEIKRREEEEQEGKKTP